VSDSGRAGAAGAANDMGVFTRLQQDEAAEIARAYALGAVHAIRGIAAGSVNSNYALDCERGIFFLRIYEEQDAAGASAEARLLKALESRGVRTPAPLSPSLGVPGVPHVPGVPSGVPSDAVPALSVAGKPVAVFPWRAGGMRCQARVTAEDARRVGAELARVHRAGEGLEVGEGRFRVEDLFGRIDVIAGATDAALASEAPELKAKLEEWTRRRGAVPEGLIHGDLFRDNVLWKSEEGGEIAGLLDFESASRGRYVFDLMVTVLAWAFGEGLDAGIARGICDGYRSVRELGEEERSALRGEGCVAALRFTITRITDYAMRSEGIGPRVIKDWRRFRMRLRVLEELGEGGVRGVLGV
jgi:homoserine kinase type II